MSLWWDDNVMWCGEVYNVMWCEWDEMSYDEMTCNVMTWDVMWCDVIRWDVMWCDM